MLEFCPNQRAVDSPPPNEDERDYDKIWSNKIVCVPDCRRLSDFFKIIFIVIISAAKN